jgi:AraC-like DNA-binding protein
VAPPREVLVFNPGVPHAGGVLDARGWSYRALYLDRSGMAGLGREMFEGEGVVPHFSSNTLPDAALAATLLAAHGALEAGPPGGLADGILAQALLHLLARYADPRPRLLALGQERRPIARAVELLRASLAEPVTVAELARCAGMSQAHFIRAFKREIGLPPHRYLTLLRLRQARRLLAAGTGAADAAVSVGFYDQSHLTRLFKRTYGITPVQYATGAAAAADG